MALYGGPGDGLVAAGYLGSERDGGCPEYGTVSAENAHEANCGLSDTELATSTDHAKRFESYGWQVLCVDDGNAVTTFTAAPGYTSQ